MFIDKLALGLGIAFAASVATSGAAHAQDTSAPGAGVSDSNAGAARVSPTVTALPMTYGSDVPVMDKRLPNRPLLLGSGTLLLASYVPTVIAGAISDRDADRYLFIPVVGPWIDLARRDCGTNGCGNNEDLNKGLIIGSGIIQGIGVLGVLASFVVPERRRQLSSAASAKKTFAIAPAQVGRSAYGVSAVGSF